MSSLIPDVVGVVGAIILMIAFLLLQLGRLSSNDLSYSILNAVGAGLIVFSLFYNFNLSAFIVELFWIAISLLGLVRVLRNRRYNT